MTIGQYLQPSQKQLPVKRFVTPEEFEDYREEGMKRGFSFVESGTFARNSYHAWKHTEEAEKAEVTEAEDHDLYANEFFKDERKHKLVCSSVVKHNLI